MTREDALTLVDHHIGILHAGPDYVQRHRPEGVVVKVTDTQLFMKDLQHPGEEPRAWHLAPIARVQLLDIPRK